MTSLEVQPQTARILASLDADLHAEEVMDAYDHGFSEGFKAADEYHRDRELVGEVMLAQCTKRQVVKVACVVGIIGVAGGWMWGRRS